MMPAVKVVETGKHLPDRSDVVIVGAGIAGMAAAWHLRKRGLSVTVLEKGRVGAEQSSRNWGWCRQQNRNPKELPLAQLSLRLWDEMNADLGEETGFRRTGLLYASTNASDVAQWEAWGRIARDYGVETHMLNGRELGERLPGNQRRWLGGVWSPHDGRAEPELATSAMARAVQRSGGVIMQDCAVRELDIAAGRIAGVVTERGRISSEAVLVAGGAWSGMLLRHHGVKILQASVKSTCFYTEPGPEVLDGAVSMETVALRRRLDGGYTVGISGRAQLQASPWGALQAPAFWDTFLIRRKKLSYGIGAQFFNGPESVHRWTGDQVSPFERVRILDPAPDQALLRRGMADLAAAYPELAKLRVACAWGGMVDNTPDAIPVISGVDHVPGLFISTGFSAHGFGIGPGAGVLAADLITGAPPSVDPTPFRYSRMIDGTKFAKPGML